MSYIENGYVGKLSSFKGFHQTQFGLAIKIKQKLIPKRERIKLVLEMIKTGISYKEIAVKTGLSVSYIRQLEIKERFHERKRRISELTEKKEIELL